MKFTCCAFVILLLASCDQRQSADNKFNDPVIEKIADLKDHRYADSLYQFFDHEKEAYRRDAAMAFGSIQDSTAVDRLARLLTDESVEVRSAAAFAIGQTASNTSASSLMDALEHEKNDAVRDELFAGIGKTILPEQIDDFLTIDHQPSRGFSWCLYRIGVRGIADSIVVARAATMLDSRYNDWIRLGAAHFFARAPMPAVQLPERAISSTALGDASTNVRMAAAQALRRINVISALETIDQIMRKEEDYRVRVSAVRSLGGFPDTASAMLFAGLNDRNEHVRIAASEGLKSLPSVDTSALLSSARKLDYWRTKANLYEAVLHMKEDTTVVREVIEHARSSMDIYAQAAYITALGQAPTAFQFVADKLLATDNPVIKSSSAGALVAMNRSEFFDESTIERFASLYKQALKINDLAVIGIISSALVDPDLGYKDYFKDYSFLVKAMELLSLPKDNEAIQSLQAAIDYFEDRPRTPVDNGFNHPIDWELVRGIPPGQRARIKTTKGDIVIRLLVEQAPGSVANFVKLSREGYYDLKNFHRVVPNFVIQGGCNRGDGWGGEDYSIRSEFEQVRYKEGSVGMASAGKDTEGTQWFITHSPTPHLDGKYTIFAEVVTGIQVVHEIQVGGLIESIELIN